MENISRIIAENLAALRRERGLSLSQLAELSGVSNVMLGQIEKARTNPTINTILKITGALKVPYSALLEAQNHEIRLVSRAEAEERSQGGADGKYTAYCYLPASPRRNFEIFGITIKAGCRSASAGHPEKTTEYIIMHDGELIVRLGETEHRLAPGDVFCFPGSQPHEYINNGPADALAFSINHYYL